MGFRNNENQLVNKNNEITYINNNHIVFGLETNPGTFSKVTVEDFLKYENYPFLLGDKISLANLEVI